MTEKIFYFENMALKSELQAITLNFWKRQYTFFCRQVLPAELKTEKAREKLTESIIHMSLNFEQIQSVRFGKTIPEIPSRDYKKVRAKIQDYYRLKENYDEIYRKWIREYHKNSTRYFSQFSKVLFELKICIHDPPSGTYWRTPIPKDLDRFFGGVVPHSFEEFPQLVPTQWGGTGERSVPSTFFSGMLYGVMKSGYRNNTNSLSPIKKHYLKTCEKCGSEFISYRSDARFCPGSKCRVAASREKKIK